MRGLRVVVAPDKFKGSLTAAQAAVAVERGFARVPNFADEVRRIPMADGGEGTVDVFVEAGAQPRSQIVSGPLGDRVRATFALADAGTAIVEMAGASGLLLLDERERDPLRASTRGTGELIRAALDAGAARIVLGIGGSATNDAGAGMLVALGARLLDDRGAELPAGAAALARLAAIDMRGIDPRIAHTTIDVACDVDSPLTGPHGSTYVFAAQKGATVEQIPQLEAALAHFADVSARVLGTDHRAVPGTGAAGGLGFALLAHLGARLRPGVEIIAEVRGLDAALADADLCITGEGRIDEQTLRGKTVVGVARRASRARVPIIAFAGSVDTAVEAELAQCGVGAAIPIVNAPMTPATAVADAPRLLESAAARVARLLAVLPRRS